MEKVTYRPIQPSDYPRLADFWKQHYELKLHKGDDEATIKLLLAKNEGISNVAELDGKLVGTCIGTFDGRKGYIQKVAVDTQLRGAGIGLKLINMTLDNIKRAGAFQIQVNCGENLVDFYQRAGFMVNNVVPMKIQVSKE